MRSALWVGAPLLAALVVWGCYADSATTGGDPKLDSGAADASEGGSTDASTDAGADAPAAACLADAMAPATWTALYADYFGPTGKASCTFNAGGCHGGAGEPGSAATGYICGPSKDACYMGITSPMAKSEFSPFPPLVAAGDAGASYLPHIVRKPGDPITTLRMPLAPNTVTFCPSDVARIEAWINAGAQND